MKAESLGKLINFDNFCSQPPKDDARLYGVKLTRLKSDLPSDWKKQVMSAHPFQISIHESKIENLEFLFWTNVRKWTERQAEGDCIYEIQDKSYRWCWNLNDSPHAFDRKFTWVAHFYVHFHFELNSDKTAFALLYSEAISDVVDELPGKPKYTGPIF